MSNTVIKIENLSKLYRLGQVGTGTLAHDLNRWWAKMRGKEDPYTKIGQVNDRTRQAESDYVWALKDINLEVKHGDLLGIIGKNGAGKSTLLKLISRITAPTTGEIKVKGRIASLLEVGTGMNPEMTARENIFLNGAILGMRRQEIDRKFDDIIDFAGCAMYVDTPFKRYSSGMRVRLGFAVAAFLEPDILIVDEVLAVGDAEFQKRAIGKMKEVSISEGRTVLFVSHQMGMIAQLCRTGLLLEQGTISTQGEISGVIGSYLNQSASEEKRGFIAVPSDEKEMFIASAQTFNADGNITSNFRHDEDIHLKITCQINHWVEQTIMGFYIRDHRGRKVFTHNNPEWERVIHRGVENVCSTVVVPNNFLVPGQYFFTLAISEHKIRTLDWIEDALSITIVDNGSMFAAHEGYDYGCVFAKCRWHIDEVHERQAIRNKGRYATTLECD